VKTIDHLYILKQSKLDTTVQKPRESG